MVECYLTICCTSYSFFPLYYSTPNGKEEIKNDILQDVSGIWETRQHTEFLIDLVSENKKIKIDFEDFKVEITNIDLENKSVEVILDNHLKWVLYRESKNLLEYNLIIKNINGNTDKLYFKEEL